MPVVNPLARELVFKVVYYGPGLGGKTTTLQHVHATTRPEHRGKMVSLATPVDRTLYFDFLPVRVPNVRGMGVRLQLFTVPGQVYYNATRKLVLTGADGVVFVADSQAARLDANLESLENLRDNLREHGRSLDELPFVLAYNKRDLEGIVSIDELEKRLNQHGAPSFATCAMTGMGVFETLDAAARLVLDDFEERMPDSRRAFPVGSFSLAEGGLVDALRSADDEHERPAPRVVREEPSEQEAVGESAARVIAGEPISTLERGGPIFERTTPILEHSTHAALDSARTLSAPSAQPFQLNGLAAPALAAPPPTPPPKAADESVVEPKNAPTTTPVSFVVLWSEEDRAIAREVEGNLQRAEWAAAVLGCGALVRRCLTRHLPEGDGDALAVTLLALGVDASRYLWLRRLITAVRGGTALPREDALLAYLFAVDVASRTRAKA